jgi:hypothetical protein
MDPEARKVQAQRNRRRLPPQRRAARWMRRIAGLIATAALLGSGVAIATMVMPDDGEDVVAAAPAATAGAEDKPAKKKTATAKKSKRAKPKGPSKAQLAMRKDAMAIVRANGYTTLRQSDYDFKATLRVLIARPVGDAAGGSRAFFFNKGVFLGNDSAAPSSKLTVARQGKVTVTLSYGVYAAGDTAGRPSERKRVRFRLVAGALTPLDTIPLDSARFQRRR